METYEQIKAKIDNKISFEEGRGNKCEYHKDTFLVSSFQQEKGNTKGYRWAHLVVVTRKDNKRYAWGFAPNGYCVHPYAVPVSRLYKKETLVQEM